MTDHRGEEDPDERAAHAVIDAIRVVADTLDERQRGMLAALLAPGIAAAWNDPLDTPAGVPGWSPDRLLRHLVAAIRAADLRIVSSTPDDGPASSP